MSKIKSETLFFPVRLYVFIFKLQSNPQETPTWKVPIVYSTVQRCLNTLVTSV